jgi:hypothetical protein
MIFRYQVNCRFCANYLGDQRCHAFPAGIPDTLWSGERLHKDPFEGDHGIRYQSRHLEFPDAETFLNGNYD